MALIQNAARIARATELRNLAVDLVAIRGAMTDARAGNTKIQVMTFENERLAILYKTPRLDLSTEGARAWIQPKGFMLDVWFDGRKTLSMQWDNEGPVDVFIFKPGEWEDLVTRALPETGFEDRDGAAHCPRCKRWGMTMSDLNSICPSDAAMDATYSLAD